MKTLALIFLHLFTISAWAQEALVPRDTSFTVYSSFVKEQKKFPFITIANPPLPAGIAVKKDNVYKTMGNRSLHVDVFYPSQTKKGGYPGVVLIHGGGWRSGDRTQTIAIAQQLAARGYVTAAVEYRLTPEAIYPAAIYDLKDLLRWMRAQAGTFHLNGNRIATMGFSSGGQLAALAGTTNGKKIFEPVGSNLKGSARIQGIIDVDGILAFKHPESEEGAVAASWLGGSYEQKPGTWKEASPLTHVDKNTPPVLFINSSIPRFHAGRDDMINRMKVYKTYTMVHTIADTPHAFWFFNPWFDEVVNVSAGFLDKIFKK